MAETTYSIEAPDGKRYGPISFDKLREWASEGRVEGATPLIVHPGGERVSARDVPGLFEGLGPPPVIAPPPGEAPPPKKGMPTWAIALVVLGGVGVCGCGVLGAILFPVFASAKQAALKSAGLSNMKQLALGAIIYSTDADDRFPTEMGSALAAKPYLEPYVQNDALFRSLNPNGGEILGDPRLSGRSMVDLVAPNEAVMFYDSKPWPRGQGLVSYTDGSARTRPFGEIEAAKAEDPFGGVKPKGRS